MGQLIGEEQVGSLRGTEGVQGAELLLGLQVLESDFHGGGCGDGENARRIRGL